MRGLRHTKAANSFVEGRGKVASLAFASNNPRASDRRVRSGFRESEAQNIEIERRADSSRTSGALIWTRGEEVIDTGTRNLFEYLARGNRRATEAIGYRG